MSFLSELDIWSIGTQRIWVRPFNRFEYSLHEASTLGIEIPSELDKAVQKRKAEFVAGRVVARDALLEHGCSGVQIPIGENRAPIWPKNFIGSISHTDDIAICSVAHSKELIFLGLDIENLMSKNQAASLLPMFTNSRELELLRLSGLLEESFTTLIFSAKESVFKAIYPHVKTYLEFSDSELVSINRSKCTMNIRLCKHGEVVVGSALELQVHFRFLRDKVMTLVCQ